MLFWYLTYPVKCQPFPQNLVVSLVFLQLWHSFDDASETMTLNLSNAQLQTNEHKNVDNNSLTTSNPFTCSITSKESRGNDSQEIFMGGLAPSEPFAPFPEPSLFATTSVVI